MDSPRSRRGAGRTVLAAALIAGSTVGCRETATTAPGLTPQSIHSLGSQEAHELLAALDDARIRLVPGLAGERSRGALTRAIADLSDAVSAGNAVAIQAATEAGDRALDSALDEATDDADLAAIRLVMDQVRLAAR